MRYSDELQYEARLLVIARNHGVKVARSARTLGVTHCDCPRCAQRPPTGGFQ